MPCDRPLPPTRAALPLLLALLIAATTPASAATTPAFRAGTFDPPYPAPELALSGSDGRPLTLGRYRGKVVLLSFGFTQCAAVCPTTMATLAQARKALGPAADGLQVVFVTVDPERDGPTRLKTYLEAFDPSFVGGTGRPELLAAARQRYGVAARKVPMGDGYAMDHTSSIFLIDREGRLRALMPYGRDAKDFVHDVKLLLAK